MRIASFASIAALILAAGAAPADDPVPNPEFANWSKFKKGTSVTVKTTSTGGGATSESNMTTTLVEVGADKLVLEYVTVTKVNGTETTLPAVKREIAKTMAAPKKEEPSDSPGKEVASKTGTETVKIAGLELKTNWRTNTVLAGETKSESKVWLSDEVPGLMVKMESTTTGVVSSTIKTELVEIKKP